MHEAITGLDVDTALERLAEQPWLAALVADDGCALMCWGLPPRPLMSLRECPELTGSSAAATSARWPLPFTGGALVQFDYEFPVGAWAHRAARPGRGAYWPLEAWLSWDAQGACHAHGSAQAIAMIRRDLTRPVVASLRPRRGPPQWAWTASEHAERVTAIRDHIRAGDIYQANLTMPVEVPLRGDGTSDVQLFRALLRRSPAGWAALLRRTDGSLISHSPECFLVGDEMTLCSAPIKGTRRRQSGREQVLRAELLTAVKDNAELAMIVDLVRNDLGRIAAPGSVQVARRPYVLDLDYVHHLLAEVTARPRAGCRLADCLAACFPPGSITGAPKIRAMQIIEQLEAGPRGPYCGSFGWIGGATRCALAVAIRTMWLAEGRLSLHAGGGIVLDSEPAAEWQELQAKLGGMLGALEDCACV